MEMVDYSYGQTARAGAADWCPAPIAFSLFGINGWGLADNLRDCVKLETGKSRDGHASVGDSRHDRCQRVIVE